MLLIAHYGWHYDLCFHGIIRDILRLFGYVHWIWHFGVSSKGQAVGEKYSSSRYIAASATKTKTGAATITSTARTARLHANPFTYACVSQVYEASMVKLHNSCATAHELAVVSRVCPDQSTLVKALIGLGRVQAFWLEFYRKRLRKVKISRGSEEGSFT